MTHALLVDDDAELRGLVRSYLRNFGMDVTAVADGRGLRRELAAHPPGTFDVLLLDLMLPDANGLDLCRWVRQTHIAPHPLPVLMLTAQGDPASRIVGLELGADDYLPKPFEPRELVARIHAVLRRTRALSGSDAPPAARVTHLRFNGWVFDRLQHQLTSPQQVVVALSNAEFRLLSAFVDHPRRVLGRDRLLTLVRAHGASPGRAEERAVDLAVSRLRQKLEDTGSSAASGAADGSGLIRTVRGEGYLFNADVE